MAESESDLITLTLKITKAENPELFARLQPIHNRRIRGSVLRSLASLGLIVTNSGIQSEKPALPKLTEPPPHPEVPIAKHVSSISDRQQPSSARTEELQPTNFKLPANY